MLSRPPLPYERTPSDDDDELRGVFRLVHETGLEFDSTYNRPSLLGLDLCEERPLRWLWEDKIPRGKLTLIEGPPAVGKLFVALDLAARATRERSAEKGERRDEETRDGESGGAAVVLVCDSWQAQDMIAARMRILGADLQKVVMFNHVICSDTCGGHKHSRPIRLPLDGRMLDYIVNKHRGCRLIVIDDLENYCETPAELRRTIRELDEAAIYFDIAIVATLQGNVRFDADGTIRDAARASDCQARCIWCITPDPTHPGLLRMEPKRMAFCKKPEGIAFRIGDDGKIVWEPLPPFK